MPAARLLGCVFASIVVLGGGRLLRGQEKPAPPPSREALGPGHQDSSGLASSLPAISLPDFVVTGSMAIEPPEIQKIFPPENESPLSSARSLGQVGDTQVGASPAAPVSPLPGTVVWGWRGLLSAGYGTFRSPRAEARLSSVSEAYDVHGEASYHRTTGFLPATDRSGGRVGVGGSLLLSSSYPWLNSARAGADVLYRSRSYRLYGSSMPSTMRTISSGELEMSLTSAAAVALPRTIGLSLATATVTDSSSTVTQTLLGASTEAGTELLGIPWEGAISFRGVTLSGSMSGQVTLLEGRFSTGQLEVGPLFVRAGLSGFLGSGTAGPGLAKLTPKILVGADLTAGHEVRVSYAPAAQSTSLTSALEGEPYLSVPVELRNQYDATAFEISLRSAWSQRLASVLAVRVSSLRDEPLLADSAQAGVWIMRYEGTTSVVSVTASAVANLSANDYFAISGTVRRFHNSVWSEHVPYRPKVEVSGWYRRTFAFGLSVEPSVAFSGDRETSLAGDSRLPGVPMAALRVEWEALRAVRLFLKAENILDRRYEVWRGYRGKPLTILLGASYQW